VTDSGAYVDSALMGCTIYCIVEFIVFRVENEK